MSDSKLTGISMEEANKMQDCGRADVQWTHYRGKHYEVQVQETNLLLTSLLHVPYTLRANFTRQGPPNRHGVIKSGPTFKPDPHSDKRGRDEIVSSRNFEVSFSNVPLYSETREARNKLTV